MAVPMTGVRINKKQRKKKRQSARKWFARAEAIAVTEPEQAARLRRVAELFDILGKPPKSKARRTKGRSAPAVKS